VFYTRITCALDCRCLKKAKSDAIFHLLFGTFTEEIKTFKTLKTVEKSIAIRCLDLGLRRPILYLSPCHVLHEISFIFGSK